MKKERILMMGILLILLMLIINSCNSSSFGDCIQVCKKVEKGNYNYTILVPERVYYLGLGNITYKEHNEERIYEDKLLAECYKQCQ